MFAIELGKPLIDGGKVAELVEVGGKCCVDGRRHAAAANLTPQLGEPTGIEGEGDLLLRHTG